MKRRKRSRSPGNAASKWSPIAINAAPTARMSPTTALRARSMAATASFFRLLDRGADELARGVEDRCDPAA